MRYPTYKINNTVQFTNYSFISSGPKGDVEISVEFSEFGNTGIYNLAFGQLTANNEIDDQGVINNADRDKILSTIAAIVYAFFRAYPQVAVFFAGSTEARTRLYRRAISLNLKELEVDFYLFGIINSASPLVEPFHPTTNYDAFVIRKRG